VASKAAPLPVCVYCRRHPVEAAWRPFCSKRCQQLDLAHWVDGEYRIAGESTDEVTLETAVPEPREPSLPPRRRRS
jgi:endogenous inhibitor of DNA gyrase (YacG/DUF329 family)